MTDIKRILADMSKELDAPIRRYIEDERPDNLIEAARQYPYAGGKRMRPAVAIVAAGAVGGDRGKAVPFGVAIEYIHNFTLVHDDLMDGDEVRRGMTTSHIKYGMPTCILAGDALFAKAFDIIADLDVPDAVMRKVLKVTSEAVWDLARGQQMDINNENGQEVSMDEYIETIRLKTSVLFAASAAGGALIGGADDRTVKAIHEYAMLLGVAFQMYDDILGIMGDPKKTGKSVGNDIRKGKSTVMVTHALMNIGDPAVMNAFRSVLGKADASEDEILMVRKILVDTGSIDFALTKAEEYTKNALAQLDVVKDGPDKDILVGIAEYAMARDV